MTKPESVLCKTCDLFGSNLCYYKSIVYAEMWACMYHPINRKRLGITMKEVRYWVKKIHVR